MTTKSSKAKVARTLHTLTPEEAASLHTLRRVTSGARAPKDGRTSWAFWRQVCEVRGLDYTTVIGLPNDPHQFSALPLGHGKANWVWPAPLKIQKAPTAYHTYGLKGVI